MNIIQQLSGMAESCAAVRFTQLWVISIFEYSPAVKAPILGEACIRVRIKYFYSFMTFGPY